MNIEIRESVKNGRFQEFKNNGKSLTFGPKKWSLSLTGGGRLLEISTVRLLEFWIRDPLQEVVAQGVSTAL